MACLRPEGDFGSLTLRWLSCSQDCLNKPMYKNRLQRVGLPTLKFRQAGLPTEARRAQVGGDGSRGYNLYSIPASFSRSVKLHKNNQAGEEIVLEVANAKALSSFRDQCLLEDRKG